MKKRSIVLGAVLLLSLSGCGKKGNIKDDYQAVQSNSDVSTTTTESESKIENVVFSARCTQYGGELSVSAEVDTNIPANLYAIEVTPHEIDDAYMMELADIIFGKDNWEIKKPYAYCNEVEAQEELDFINELMEEKEDTNGFYVVSEPYYQLRQRLDYPMELDATFEEGQIIGRYDELIEEDGKSVLLTEYEGRIQGKIAGKWYELYYKKIEVPPNDLFYTPACSLDLYPVDAEPYVYSYQDDGTAYGKNGSDYEECKLAAEEMLRNMGFDNYTLADSKEALTTSSQSGIWNYIDDSDLDPMTSPCVDGYRFFFSPEVDGMKVGFYSTNRTTNQYDYDWSSTEEYYQPYIIISVNNDGVYKVKFESLYDFGEVLSSECSLIGLDKANENVKTAFAECYRVYSKVTEIKLEYIVVRNGNDYALVPAWVYYTETMVGYKGSLMAVNALDGSVVHFSENFLLH